MLQSRSTSRTRTLKGLGALVVFAIAAAGVVPLGDLSASAEPPAAGIPWTYTRLSVAPDGGPADGPSTSPALSGDGRHVAFITSATNLTDTTFDSPGAVVIRDLVSAQTALIDVQLPGNTPPDPTAVDVNRDGTVIATATDADYGPLVVTDRVARTTVATGWARPAQRPLVSDSGDRVSYADVARGKESVTERVTIHELPTDTATVLYDPPTAWDTSGHSSMNAAGTRVALDTTFSGEAHDVRIFDTTDATAPVAVATIDGARLPSLDASGERVAYLAAGSDGTRRLVVRDLATGNDDHVVDLTNDLVLSALEFSADGSTIAYRADGDETATIVVVDVATGAAEVVASTGLTDDFDLSADGRTIVFSSRAALVAGDDDASSDVFIAHRTSRSAPTWPAGAALTSSDVGASFVNLTWPAATDDLGVANYVVSLGGEIVAQLDAMTFNHVIRGLTPATAHHFEVHAVDADGSESSALTLEVTTAEVDDTPGTAALSLAPGPGGRIELAWDPAPEVVASYVIERSSASDPHGDFTTVTSVDADTTTYLDQNLAAATSYTYRVLALGDDTRIHTVERAATTPVVALTSTDWHGRLHLNGALDIELTGGAGWVATVEVEHTSWFADDGTVLENPREVVTTIAAAEDATAAGHYRATFPLIDGIASVHAIRGVLADGHGSSSRRTSTTAAGSVRGAVHVQIENPDDDMFEGRVVVAGVAQRPFGDWTSWDLEAVLAGDRTVTAYDQQGNVLATTPLTAIDGRGVTAVVTPRHIGQVALRLVEESGTPIVGATATFTLLPDRTALGSATSDRFGVIRALGTLHVDDQVEVTVTPPRSLDVQPITVSRVAVPVSPTPVDVTMPTTRTGVLVGRVTIGGTMPAVGARVVATQWFADGHRTFTATTDDNGGYDLRAHPGVGTVTVNYRRDPVKHVGNLTFTETPVSRDIDLQQAGTYRLETTIRTRTVDNPTWRTITSDQVHGLGYRLTVSNGTTTYPLTEGVHHVRAEAGDTFTICGDGRSNGIGADCETVTLADDAVVPFELEMEAKSGVRGRVVQANGRPYDDSTVTVSFSRQTPTGFESTTYRGSGDGNIDSPLSEPGRYRAEIGVYDASALSRSTRYRIIEFDVIDGEIVDLGDILMESSPFLRRSDVTVSRSTVPVGGVIDVRAAIRPDASGLRTAIAAQLTIPAGATLVSGSVTLDGAPATASLDGDIVTVEIGDRIYDASKADDATIVRYRLDTDGVEPGAGFGVVVRVRSTFGSSTTTALVGSPTVRVAGVTLSAPDHAATGSINIGGLAPAGLAVIVTDRGQEVGRPIATPGGRWSLATTLPNRGPGEEHDLVASVTMTADDGSPITVGSAMSTVLVDPRLPELVGLSLIHTRYGFEPYWAVSVDPREGSTRVPLVTHGNPANLDVEMQFAGRGSASDVGVEIGTQAATNASYVGDGLYRIHASSAADTLGGVSPTYELVPDMATLADVPVFTETEVRDMLPPDLADMEPEATTLPETDPATTTGQMVLPAPDGSTWGDATLSFTRGLTYTPTPADLTLATRAGVPAYGLTFDVTKSGDKRVIRASFLVPEAMVDGDETPIASLSGFGVVRTGFEAAFTWGTTAESFLGAATSGGKYGRLGEIQNLVNRSCNAANQSRLQFELEDMRDDLLASDIFKVAMTVAGGLAGPATFGIGTVAIWAVTFLADKLIDAHLNDRMDQLEAEVKEECNEENEDPFKDWPEDRRPDRSPAPRFPSPPAAPINPVWIHDPSGYVFEAVPSNRIAGATATLTHSETAEGPFEVWDADWYEQSNPLRTDALGAYGWDVPEGFWQVVYTKDGFETARSEVLEVLPPHFDVNVGMRRTAPPAVASATAHSGAAGDAVTVTFDNYMRLDAADRITVSDIEGDQIDGQVHPIDAEDAPTGRFATTFRFVPDGTRLVGDDRLNVAVAALASDHAGRPMLDDFTTMVDVVADDREAPAVTATLSEDAGEAGWHRGPVTVTLHADDRDRGSGVAAISWAVDGNEPGEGSESDGDVAIDVSADGPTTVRFTATDLAGNVSEEGSVTVRIDATLPTVSIDAPNSGAKVTQSGALEARFSCADSGSGVTSCVATLADGSLVPPGSRLRTSVVGIHPVEVTATDVAGNVATSTVTYEVTAPAGSTSTLKLIDKQYSLVRSLRLPVLRELVLTVPLLVAKTAVVLRSNRTACSAMSEFDKLVVTFAKRNWLTSAQAATLRSGVADIVQALAC